MKDEEKKPEVQADYVLTEDYRAEDQGQKLPKFRIVEKTLPQTYIFSFQDIHTMIATFQKELKGIEVERADLDRKQKRAEAQLALWESELKIVTERFPELTSEPSPYIENNGGEPEAEEPQKA